jgi:hypothetical protein
VSLEHGTSDFRDGAHTVAKDKVQKLSTKGHSYTEIASILRVAVTSMASSWGIGVFTVTVVAYGIGQYFILEFLNRKSRVIKVNLAFFKVLSSTVTIIQYVLTALFGIILVQILLNWHYFTVVVNLASTISYALAAVTIGILTSKFFLWYMSNRNFVVLLYSVSTASVTITMLLTLVFVSIALSTLPGERGMLHYLQKREKV